MPAARSSTPGPCSATARPRATGSPTPAPPAGCAPPPARAPAQGGGALFDFRPVLRNRSAMAYALAYCAHTWEMNALRGWVVAFLAYVIVATGDGGTWVGPTVVATVMGFIGTWTSVVGNELSIRLGRQRLVRLAMLSCAVMAAGIGFLGARADSPAAGAGA